MPRHKSGLSQKERRAKYGRCVGCAGVVREKTGRYTNKYCKKCHERIGKLYKEAQESRYSSAAQERYRGVCMLCFDKDSPLYYKEGRRFCQRCANLVRTREFNHLASTRNKLERKCLDCESKEIYDHSRCKDCYGHLQRKRNYGITKEQYFTMIKQQGNKCAICGIEEKDSPRQKDSRLSGFAVDHDHKTGKVRGLLCFYCNTGLGTFRDSVDYLQNAIKYLQGMTAYTTATLPPC